MDISHTLNARLLYYPDSYADDIPKEERAKACKTLEQSLCESVKGGNALPAPELLERLAYYPEAMENALYAVPPESPCFSIMASSSPEAAYRVLTHNYDGKFSEALELMLLNSPEIVLRLMEWSLGTKTPLRFGEDAYLHSIMSDMLCAWSYFKNFKGGGVSGFLSLIDEYHAGDYPHTPQNAILQLFIGNAKLSEPLIKLISLAPKPAIMAAIMFEGFPRQSLLQWAEYPQWAYNILMNVPSPTNEVAGACMESLLRCLPWLHQYFKDIGQKNRNREIYTKLMNIAVKRWNEFQI